MTLIVKISLSVLAVIVFQRVAAVPHGTSENDGLLRRPEKSGPRNWGKIKSLNTGSGQDAVGIFLVGGKNEEMMLISLEEDDEEYLEYSEGKFLLDLGWAMPEDYAVDLRRFKLPTSGETEEDLTNAGGRASEKITTDDEVAQILKPSNQDGCVPGRLIWPCSCSTSGEGDVSITCRNAQGPDLIHKALIPNYPRANLKILNIAKSNVGRLPKDILHGKTFEEMNLYGSGIRGIEEGAFAGCQETLRLIRLNSNRLQSFNFTQLVNFPHLEMIALSDNQLTSIEGFVGLPKLPLTTLYIGQNLIESLPSDVFISLENLGLLDLSYNDISFIPEGVFLPLKQLEVIYLQGNKLGHISTGAFWFSTPILRSLDIRKLDARTTDVDIFRGVGLSTTVNFDMNHMKHLYEETFEPVLRNVSTEYGWFSVFGSWLVCDCDVLWILEDQNLIDHLFSATCNNWTYLSDLNYDVLAEQCAQQTTQIPLWEEDTEDELIL